MREGFIKNSFSGSQREHDALSMVQNATAKSPEALVEGSNSTITAIDNFVDRSIYTLNYLANTLEKGNDLNQAMDRIASLVVEVLAGNPIVKVTVAITKKVTELVVTEVQKTKEANSGVSATPNSSESLDDSFIKSTITTVIESPQVQGIMKDIISNMSNGIDSPVEEKKKETSGFRASAMRRRMG